MNKATVRMVETYLVRGAAPTVKPRYAIKTPTTSGRATLIFIEQDNKKSSIRVLCPWTLTSHTIPATSAEAVYASTIEKDDQDIGNIVLKSWQHRTRLGCPCDFNTASAVLGLLGITAPAILETAGLNEPSAKRAHKAWQGEPCKPGTKKEKIARFFEKEPRSLVQGEIELEISRASILSHLSVLQSRHGVGYELVNGTCQTVIPASFDNPIEGRASKSGPVKEHDTAKEVRPIKSTTVRAAILQVIIAQNNDVPIETLITILNTKKATLLSHLYSAWQDSGVGYIIREGRVSLKEAERISFI